MSAVVFIYRAASSQVVVSRVSPLRPPGSLCDTEEMVPQHTVAARPFGTSVASLVSGICGTMRIPASRNRSRRAISWVGESTGPEASLRPKELHHVADVLCEHVVVAARQHGDRAHTQRRSSSSPAGSSNTLMDWNSIPRTERNSLSFRQLVHPGCQKTFSGMVADMLPRVKSGP